jgi:hypothetical protein
MSSRQSSRFCIAIFAAFAVLPRSSLADDVTEPSRAARALFEGGVRKCLYHLDLLVKFAHEDDESYAFITTLGEPVEDAGYTVITVENLGRSAVTRTFAVTPDQSQGCSVSTTLVTPTATSCAVARDNVLSDWKFYGDLGVAAAYELESEPHSTVVLTPNEKSGCVLIKSSNQSFIGDNELKDRSTKKDRKRL